MDSAYYLVSASALPEIFLKVCRTKRMLETGEAATVGEAARMQGISRSVFYKYKDAVVPFNDMITGRIVTFQATLLDRPGILSAILSIFAGSGANILTINQSIPQNGHASLTISVDTTGLIKPLEALILNAREQNGVISFDILGG